MNGKRFMKTVIGKVAGMMKDDKLEETAQMIERIAVLRVATKHINLWTRQLEIKRMEMIELAGLMGFEKLMKEIGNEKSLES